MRFRKEDSTKGLLVTDRMYVHMYWSNMSYMKVIRISHVGHSQAKIASHAHLHTAH